MMKAIIRHPRRTGAGDGLLLRTFSAVVGVPVILAVLWLGGIAFALGTGAVMAVAMAEMQGALMPQGIRWGPLVWPRHPLAWMGIVLMGLMVAGAYHGGKWWMGAASLAFVLPLLASLPRPKLKEALGEWALVAAATAYIGILGSHLVALRQGPNGMDWTMVAIFGAFATDTSAYLVGRAVGKNRLVPHLSPGKTWEGTLGGMALGAGGVLLLNWATGLRLGASQIGPLAFFLPLAAVLGDLVESFIKRGAAVKDTSALVPGHGGFLDRLDSIFFTVPLVYYWRFKVMGWQG